MGIGIGIYVNNSREAVDLYRTAFGLELGYHVLNDDGTYYHSDLLKNGQSFISVAEAKNTYLSYEIDLPHINPVEIGYTVENREEFDRIFSLLKEHGTILLDVCTLPWSPCAAVVQDQYGVRWFITSPQHRPADDAVLPQTTYTETIS